MRFECPVSLTPVNHCIHNTVGVSRLGTTELATQKKSGSVMTSNRLAMETLAQPKPTR